MKPRFKFDENWSKALRLLGDNGEAEQQFRRYVEESIEPDWLSMPHLEGLEAVWLLFKSEVDIRKARNSKARERRRRLREAATREKTVKAKKAAASTAARKTRKTQKMQNEAAKRAVENAVEAAQLVDETMKITILAAAANEALKREERRMKAAPHRSTISSGSKHSTTGNKSAFAARFRGPGIGKSASMNHDVGEHRSPYASV